MQSNDSLLEAEAAHSIHGKMSELSSEMKQLAELSVTQDDELQELELVSWDDKLRIETEQVRNKQMLELFSWYDEFRIETIALRAATACTQDTHIQHISHSKTKTLSLTKPATQIQFPQTLTVNEDKSKHVPYTHIYCL